MLLLHLVTSGSGTMGMVGRAATAGTHGMVLMDGMKVVGMGLGTIRMMGIAVPRLIR